jgi:hypothetical protein
MLIETMNRMIETTLPPTVSFPETDMANTVCSSAYTNTGSTVDDVLSTFGANQRTDHNEELGDQQQARGLGTFKNNTNPP